MYEKIRICSDCLVPQPTQKQCEDGEEQEGRGRQGESTGMGSAHEDANERSGRRDSPLIAF
ncbi:hypothetical protein D3H55_18035 [Bacillus salacetis]|uniref:Uncharacterized protein n=1 Tax=Bacillus salacetis TaxID=2315464 RepID=A0A3A1QWJ1_9BACI|nr:hypothetical protein D3H55_18035 [Bacillus salacetis]